MFTDVRFRFAAVQAAILKGVMSEADAPILIDVTALSVGTETAGAMTALISRNTSTPTKRSQTFTTDADKKTEIEVKVSAFVSYREAYSSGLITAAS